MPFPPSPPISAPTAATTPSRSWRKTTRTCGCAAGVVTMRTRSRPTVAGYSGTPLPQKLGIKPQFRVAFVGLPGDVKTVMKKEISACRLVKDGQEELDFAMIFVKSQAEMKTQFVSF